MVINRYAIIKYGYTSQFAAYGFMFAIAAMVGCFSKGPSSSFSPFDMSHYYTDTPCSPAIEVWFGIYLFFVPFAIVFSALIAKFRAKGRFTRSQYNFEKFHREYVILTDNDKCCNYSVMFLDIFNILWAVVGSILDQALKQTQAGAIDECMKDYGIGTTCLAFVMMVLGWCKIMRFVFYLLCLVMHQDFFGDIERNTRFNNVQGAANLEDMTTLKFKMIKYKSPESLQDIRDGT